MKTKIIAAILAFQCLISAQLIDTAPRLIYTSSTKPSTCATGSIWFNTGTNPGQYDCTSTNTWTGVTATRSLKLYASQIAGVVLDANLLTGAKIGGGTATDNTTLINSTLAVAAAANAGGLIDFVLDGPTVISQVLIPPGANVVFEGTSEYDTGVFVKSGSNSTAICNLLPGQTQDTTHGCQDGPTGSAPAQAGKITIRNMTINGNRGTYPNGNSTNTDARGNPWIQGVTIASAIEFNMENVYLYDAPTFGVLTSNVGASNVGTQHFRNITVMAPSLAINTDGIHICGTAGFVYVDSSYFTTGDDSIALNAPECFSGYIAGGQISNSWFYGSLTAYRQYASLSNATPGVGPVEMTNSGGSVLSRNGITAAVARLGEVNGGTKATDGQLSFRLSNSWFRSDGYYLDINDPIGTVQLSNDVWDSPNAANPFLHVATNSTVSSYSCDNSKIYRTTAGSAAAYAAQITSGSTVKQYNCPLAIENEQGQSYSALAALISVPSGAAITNLNYTDVAPLNTTTIASASDFSRIASVSGVSEVSATFAIMSAMTLTNGSKLYCSDCTVTSGSDDTCAGSGSGANVFRNGGVSKCVQ